jgi:hypothetical protein
MVLSPGFLRRKKNVILPPVLPGNSGRVVILSDLDFVHAIGYIREE